MKREKERERDDDDVADESKETTKDRENSTTTNM